eukprot:2342188-Pyramimonas_sp.AAC.1
MADVATIVDGEADGQNCDRAGDIIVVEIQERHHAEQHYDDRPTIEQSENCKMDRQKQCNNDGHGSSSATQRDEHVTLDFLLSSHSDG